LDQRNYLPIRKPVQLMTEPECLPWKHILLFGFLTWLVPFLVAIPFYSPQGSLLVTQALFKSVMIVVGAATGTLLLVLLLGKVRSRYIETGAMAGITWLLMNCVLDLLVLVGGMKMDPFAWLTGIGLGYLIIPLYAAGAGYIAEQASQKRV
jgi:hypothetical protein